MSEENKPEVELIEGWIENPGGIERTRRALVRIHRENEPPEKMLYERREERDSYDGDWDVVPVTQRRSMRHLEDVPKEDWPEHNRKGWVDVYSEFPDEIASGGVWD